MSGSSRLDALRWLLLELRNEYARTREFALIHDFLAGIEGFEREMLLHALFGGALEEADWTLAERCLDEGDLIIPNEWHESGPLHTAMSHLGNRPDVIAWLLQHGAEVDRRGPSNVTPLISAAYHGWDAVVQLLLEAGADVNSSREIDENETALMAAAEAGQAAVVKLLLAAGADPHRTNIWNAKAADIADSKGHDDVARLIRSQSR